MGRDSSRKASLYEGFQVQLMGLALGLNKSLIYSHDLCPLTRLSLT